MKRAAALLIALLPALPILLLPALPAGAQSDYVLPPLSDFTAMVERPLFAPSRLGTAPAVAARPDTGGGRRLVGTMRRGREQIALLLIDGKGHALALGEVLDGWRLLSVEAGAVTLVAADGTNLRLPVGGTLP